MNTRRALIALIACWLLVAGCGVNKSIYVADGETVEAGKATVNGKVTIGSNCQVRGDCRTVNGRVTVGSGSEVGGLQTVNGSIRIANNVSVDGDVATVNGSIRLAENTSVGGEVETVNGSVDCAFSLEVVFRLHKSLNLTMRRLWTYRDSETAAPIISSAVYYVMSSRLSYQTNSPILFSSL